MFRAQLFAVSLALALVGTTIGIGLFRFNSFDLAAYQRLVERSSPQKKGGLSTYSQQVRYNVNKEVWFHENDPLHFNIQAEESELFLFHDDKNNVEVIEEMHKVHCTMQEELFYLLPDGREAVKEGDGKLFLRGGKTNEPRLLIDSELPGLIPMQLVRYFEAEKASYNYTSQLFCAKSVKLWKYRLQGHNPPISFDRETPLMSGTARSVEFLMKGKELNFTAHTLKATFDPKKGAV